jgi:hypothetical protein
MYTKQEMARLRETFWTAFGKYMAPVPSSEGQKINWINYKTGIKHIRFVMQLNDRDALTGILITHPDEETRNLFFNRFVQLKTMFEGFIEGDWVWDAQAYDEFEKPVSIIYTELAGKTIKDQQNWPDIISFFKKHMMALDGFWELAKDGFEGI